MQAIAQEASMSVPKSVARITGDALHLRILRRPFFAVEPVLLPGLCRGHIDRQEDVGDQADPSHEECGEEQGSP